MLWIEGESQTEPGHLLGSQKSGNRAVEKPGWYTPSRYWRQFYCSSEMGQSSWVSEGCLSQPEKETSKSRSVVCRELDKNEWEFFIWVASKAGCGHEGNSKVEGTLGEVTCPGLFREPATVGWKGSLFGGVANVVRTQRGPHFTDNNSKKAETLQYQPIQESLNPRPGHMHKCRVIGQSVFVQGCILVRKGHLVILIKNLRS